jgi:hypothetical protein
MRHIPFLPDLYLSGYTAKYRMQKEAAFMGIFPDRQDIHNSVVGVQQLREENQRRNQEIQRSVGNIYQGARIDRGLKHGGIGAGAGAALGGGLAALASTDRKTRARNILIAALIAGGLGGAGGFAQGYGTSAILNEIN